MIYNVAYFLFNLILTAIYVINVSYTTISNYVRTNKFQLLGWFDHHFIVILIPDDTRSQGKPCGPCPH